MQNFAMITSMNLKPNEVMYLCELCFAFVMYVKLILKIEQIIG